MILVLHRLILYYNKEMCFMFYLDQYRITIGVRMGRTG